MQFFDHAWRSFLIISGAMIVLFVVFTGSVHGSESLPVSIDWFTLGMTLCGGLAIWSDLLSVF